MPAWTDYTSKTTPADTDEVMIKDFSDSNKANKRMLFSGLWNWIVNKLTNAVIANLETSPQTIVGAINSLNSNIQNKFYHSDGTKVMEYVNDESNRNYITYLNGWALSGDYSALPTKSGSMYQIFDYYDLSWGHVQIWELYGSTHAVYARSYSNGTWTDFVLYTSIGSISNLATTAKDSLVSAVNEVNNKIGVAQFTSVDNGVRIYYTDRNGKNRVLVILDTSFGLYDADSWEQIWSK